MSSPNLNFFNRFLIVLNGLLFWGDALAQNYSFWKSSDRWRKSPTIFNIRACAIVDFVVRKITIANHFGG
jgi:hypothetical protein